VISAILESPLLIGVCASVWFLFHVWLIPFAGMFLGLGLLGVFLAVFAANSWLLAWGFRNELCSFFVSILPEGFIRERSEEEVLADIEAERRKSKQM